MAYDFGYITNEKPLNHLMLHVWGPCDDDDDSARNIIFYIEIFSFDVRRILEYLKKKTENDNEMIGR